MRHPLIALAALLASAGLAVILWMAGLSPWLDVFRQLWVVWVIAGSLCLAISLPNRMRWAKWANALLLCAIIAPGLPETIARRTSGPSVTVPGGDLVRLVTHNMWVANIAPERTRTLLTELDADIMALQESNGRAAEAGFQLADQFPHAARCRSTRILSRFEIIESGCLEVPGQINWATAIPCDWEIPPGVWARIQLPSGREAIFISTHLTWPIPGDTQMCQRNGLGKALAEWVGEPVVLMGDFNAAAPSLALRRMEEAYGLGRRSRGIATYPSRSRFEAAGLPLPVADPMLIGIDHIFASADWWTQAIASGPDTGSDHRPLVATLILRDAN